MLIGRPKTGKNPKTYTFSLYEENFIELDKIKDGTKSQIINEALRQYFQMLNNPDWERELKIEKNQKLIERAQKEIEFHKKEMIRNKKQRELEKNKLEEELKKKNKPYVEKISSFEAFLTGWIDIPSDKWLKHLQRNGLNISSENEAENVKNLILEQKFKVNDIKKYMEDLC